jgi:hypothetical protein
VPITTNVVSLNPALDFWLKKFFLCDLPFLIFCISDIIHCICKRRKILSMNRDYWPLLKKTVFFFSQHIRYNKLVRNKCNQLMHTFYSIHPVFKMRSKQEGRKKIQRLFVPTQILMHANTNK